MCAAHARSKRTGTAQSAASDERPSSPHGMLGRTKVLVACIICTGALRAAGVLWCRAGRIVGKGACVGGGKGHARRPWMSWYPHGGRIM
eukprot:794786-Prymnesium_polylepis.2